MRLGRFRGVDVVRARRVANADLLDDRLLAGIDEVVVLVRQRREDGKHERDGQDRGAARKESQLGARAYVNRHQTRNNRG